MAHVHHGVRRVVRAGLIRVGRSAAAALAAAPPAAAGTFLVARLGGHVLGASRAGLVGAGRGVLAGLGPIAGRGGVLGGFAVGGAAT